MPRHVSKEATLNGEAFIIKFEHREFYYLRVKREGDRYTNVSLETTDIAVARKNALNAYIKVVAEPPKSRSRNFLFLRACDDYLKEKLVEVVRKQLSPNSHELYRQRIHQRIIPYASFVGIKTISDIRKNSFENYAGFHLDMKVKGRWKSATSGLSTSTINSDITTLRNLLKWMVKRELLDPKNLGEIQKLKDRTNYREESNPAFLPEEFILLKDELYKFDQNIENEELRWKHRWFINWVLFQYQSGCRIHETAQILVEDCEIQKRPDGKMKGIVNIASSTKTGRRTVIMNGHTLRKVKYHLTKGIKIRNQQVESYNLRVRNGEVKDRDGNPKPEMPIFAPPKKDDLIMMNPFLPERSSYHVEHIRNWWKKNLQKCSFEKRYTLYSLRSTYITHALLKGIRTRVIADNAGTSEAMIEKTYYLLSNLLNIDELGFHKETDDDELVVD